MMDGQQRRSGTAGEPSEGPGQPPSLRSRRSAAGAFSPAPSSFAPNRRPAAPADRRFAPTEHLAPEAVAAFVDGELGSTAHMRATHHLALCPECVAAVDAQMSARTRLRSSGTMAIPTDLLGQLSQIPTREFDMSGRLDPSVDGVMGPSRRSRRANPVDAASPDLSRSRMQRWRGR